MKQLPKFNNKFETNVAPVHMLILSPTMVLLRIQLWQIFGQNELMVQHLLFALSRSRKNLLTRQKTSSMTTGMVTVSCAMFSYHVYDWQPT